MSSTRRARLIRERALAEGWSTTRIADEIAAQCDCSPLAAQRLARGWTLEKSTRHIAELRRAHDFRGGTTTVQMLNAWERGRVVPSMPSVDLLCRLYQLGPDRLGLLSSVDALGGPGSTGAGVPVERPGSPADAAALVRQLLPAPGQPPDRALLDLVAGIRSDVDELLQPIADIGELTRLEQVADEYMRTTSMAGQPDRLAELMTDVTTVRSLLARGQGTRYRVRALRVLAQLAAVVGLSMLMLGFPSEADKWLATAANAARSTGDRSLASWIAVNQAMLGSAYGSAREGLERARQARALLARPVGLAAVWAPALEARALGRLGGTDRSALYRMQAALDRGRPSRTAAALDLPSEFQMAWCQAATLVSFGESRRAWKAFAGLSDNYPALVAPVRPIVAIDQTRCLIVEGEISRACQVIREEFMQVTPEVWGIARTNVRRVLDDVPPRYQGLTVVRDLRADLVGTLSA